MSTVKVENLTGGNLSWLGSTHGIGNARTVTLDPSSFTKATHYPDGYLLSGLPITLSGGVAGPYNGETLDGFLLTEQSTDGTTKIAVPLLDHGRVKTALIPGGKFTAATVDNTTVVFQD
ncbi:hypothetical protein QDX21_07085 [Auritidibacter ignavus]|uniref:Head decoration protein n=1 Tax=Auritidibacter ignavus TaxID=678932 RepID=A0AAJ6DB82_9MICC|nr:hypothetical protein [Auritidibacter ignavus]WGH92099.1 hypothetical protein QDX21_07085 [Auritidibacter ignavus]